MSNVKGLQQNLEREAEQILSELQRLGDEIRLKAHLASAEGREAWQGLEPQLQQFKRRIEGAGDSALQELRGAGQELRANLERLCQELRARRDSTARP